MIEFFTALILIYHIHGEPQLVSVFYDTEDRCQEAMDRGVMMPLYNQLHDLYGNDIMMYCRVTEEVSQYPIKPKLKPSTKLGTSLTEEENN